MKYTLVLLSFLIVFLSSFAEAQTIYYDVNFSSPLNTVGSPPVTGQGINTPSNIVFGQPIVMSAFGALTDQPLVFNTAGSPYPGYEQIQFNLGYKSNRYYISFDLLTNNFTYPTSLNNFNIFLDAPEVRIIKFMPMGDNSISIYADNWMANSFQKIGDLSDQTLVHMDVDVNLMNNTWTIFRDKSFVYTSAFNSSINDIRAIRFSLAPITSDSPSINDSVGVDNILITNGPSIVPEPISSILFVTGGTLLAGRSYIRKKKKA